MSYTYSSRTADKFVVRLPDGMREEIAERAKANNRSMNSEIVVMLKNQLNGGESLSDSAIALIDLVKAELGERTSEQREQEYKFAIGDFITGRGLPHNAMEVIVRGRTGVGKSTLLRIIGENLQAAVTAANLPAPPTVYLTMSDSTRRGLEQVSFRHDRTIFLTDYEQESRQWT